MEQAIVLSDYAAIDADELCAASCSDCMAHATAYAPLITLASLPPHISNIYLLSTVSPDLFSCCLILLFPACGLVPLKSACLHVCLQEVIGSALALVILSGGRIPIWAGVIITSGDCFLLLLVDRLGFRFLEAIFAICIGIMSGTFGVSQGAGSGAATMFSRFEGLYVAMMTIPRMLVPDIKSKLQDKAEALRVAMWCPGCRIEYVAAGCKLHHKYVQTHAGCSCSTSTRRLASSALAVNVPDASCPAGLIGVFSDKLPH